MLLIGTLFARGRRTVTAALRQMGLRKASNFTLHHQVLNRTLLHKDDAQRVLQMVANLWGYAVVLKEVEPSTGAIFQEHVAHPHETLF